MRLMISGATPSMERFVTNAAMSRHLGAMVTPNTGNSVARVCSWGVPWCVDSGSFKAAEFDAGRYLALLRKVKAAPTQPAFVVVPDQVGDHDCTSYLFEKWLLQLYREGLDDLPRAFVLQDGIESADDVPWGDVSAVFVGGSDEFKLGDLVMMELIPQAKARGKWVHFGRVNGRRRLKHVTLADADSVDGTSMSRFAKTWIPQFIVGSRLAEIECERLDRLNAQFEEEIRRAGEVSL